MFETTLPAGVPDLMRVSGFRRMLDTGGRGPESAPSCLSSLSPSLRMDLQRFERGGRHTELLEVIAASVRHGRGLVIQLACDSRVLPLTIRPRERLAHCPLPPAQFLQLPLDELLVLQVEPAPPRPAGAEAQAAAIHDWTCYTPLGALAWELALRGSRRELLPEISPRAAYRIPPGVDLRGLELGGSLAAAVQRMQRQTTNLKDLASWPGFDRERAMRLLNALYLQAGLMVTRTHPAAINDGWMP